MDSNKDMAHCTESTQGAACVPHTAGYAALPAVGHLMDRPVLMAIAVTIL